MDHRSFWTFATWTGTWNAASEPAHHRPPGGEITVNEALDAGTVLLVCLLNQAVSSIDRIMRPLDSHPRGFKKAQSAVVSELIHWPASSLNRSLLCPYMDDFRPEWVGLNAESSLHLA